MLAFIALPLPSYLLHRLIYCFQLQPELLRALSDALVNVSNDALIRQAAGIQLKNRLYSKDQEIKEQYKHRWLSLPEDIRNYIKNNSINTLGTETIRPSAAAQCIAYIAIFELPLNRWP